VNARLDTLQAGRAIAAIAVAFHHAAQSAATFGGALPPWFSAITDRLYLGVDFFFVLSGFIIYHISQGQKPDNAWALNFFASRAFRIYVPYLPIGIIVALAYTLLPGISSADREWSWFASITLIPSADDAALIVAWTLRHEITFYALFLIAYRARLLWQGVALWAALIAVSSLTDLSATASFLLSPINLEFIFGMVAAWAFRSGRMLHTTLPGGLAVLGYVLLGATPELRCLFALGTALLMLSFVRAEQAGRLELVRPIRFLGDASYSIYLVHAPLIALLARAGGPWFMAVPLLVGCGVLSGLAYYLMWEQPTLKIFKRRQYGGKQVGSPPIT
jgi:peptidoglycan/LPS O-acetylase OafA/YrhL